MSVNTKLEDEKEGASPSWIDIPLITKALEGLGEENPQVTAITTGLATKPGVNYGSTLYRVTATLTGGETRSVLVKSVPPGSFIQFALKGGIFEREALLLADVIPKIEALLEEVAPGRWGPMAARCPLHVTTATSSPFLVLEDLATPGFVLADKRRGLGLRHSLMALRTLARFHAGSFALLQREPELAQQLDNKHWRENFEQMESVTTPFFQTIADVVKTWPGFESYAPLLENYKKIATKKNKELNEPKPGAFNVIIHGDFWLNNMMFRYNEEGEVCDYRLVDLQISHVASPAIDVVYFLAASVSEDVSTHHQCLLVREYHFALQEALALLGYKAPSLEQLKSDINVHGSISLMPLLLGLPVQRAEKPVDFEESQQGDKVSETSNLYELPTVKKWIQRVLPEYKRRGWLPEL